MRRFCGWISPGAGASDRKLFAARWAGAAAAGPALLETAAEGGASFPVAGTTRGGGALHGGAGAGPINDAQYFEGVSPAVWNFHVGGTRCARSG
jgi:hypothetical protein